MLGSGKAAKRHCNALFKLYDLYEIVDNFQDADIIDVCNAHYKHFPDTRLYLGRGKHVICEKPPVESLWELSDLATKETMTGKTMFPISQYRFVPFNVGSGLYTFRRHAEYYDVNWRRHWSTAFGGALINQGYHILDWYANKGVIRNVKCQLVGSSVPGVEVEAGASIEIEYYGVDTPVQLSIITGPVIPEIDFGDSDLGYERQFQKIYYSITLGEDAPVPRNELTNTMELITACYWSGLHDGKEVKLPISMAHEAYRGWTPLAFRRLLQQGSFLQKSEEPSGQLCLPM